MTLSVSGLCVYPVKSTAGQPRHSARVMPAGLEHDRRWMLVDREGRFITGRDQPQLVRVTATPSGEGLGLAAPGHASLHIADARGRGPAMEVTVWRDRVRVQRVDPAADDWFSRFLGTSCVLVYLPDTSTRAIDPTYARPGDQVSFADGYPLLLIGDASLDDLNTRAPQRAEMARFRPNITVAGTSGFAEDRWQRIRVGTVEFEVPKPCDRCVMTTVHPTSGEKHPALEPLRTLSAYRRDREGGILFGVNLIARGNGTIAVGDAVEVLSCGDSPSVQGTPATHD